MKPLIFAKPLVFLCATMLATTNSASGQESDDHKAIRDLLTNDQEAWINGDGKAVLKIALLIMSYVEFRAITASPIFTESWLMTWYRCVKD